MATSQRRQIDRDRRGHVTAECSAPHLDGSGLLGDVSRSAARQGSREHQAVSCSLDDVIAHWCGSEGGHIFESRPMACAGQPPFFQGLRRVVPQMTGAIAERERLEKGDDDRFLFGSQGREAGRIPIRRPFREQAT